MRTQIICCHKKYCFGIKIDFFVKIIFLEPVNQSTPVKPRLNGAGENGPPPVLPFVRSHSIKRPNRFDTIYRSGKSANQPVTKIRSHSYRETRSEINTNVPLLRTAPNLFFRVSYIMSFFFGNFFVTVDVP